MQNLLSFLYRFRTFGLFLLLEIVCAWLIITYNSGPNAAFLNSSNSLVANINSFTNNTSEYFRLKKVNQQLIEENLLLREQLANSSLGRLSSDTSMLKPYKLLKSKVINNTYRRSLNYMTLNAGSSQGIETGMGVISAKGVVGQVKSVSGNFATVTSLLHRNLLISSVLRNTGTLCTVQWDGKSPGTAALKYIPRHIPLSVGDSIVTSGYNSVFPPGVLVGVINDFNLEEDDVFYEAAISLATDFSSLEYVYIVQYEMRAEQDSLEHEIVIEQ